MSEEKLLSALNLSKINFSKARIFSISKEFNETRYKFSKSKTKEIRRNLLQLEENFFKPKKYYDYNDIEYKGIRNVQDLFDLSID